MEHPSVASESLLGPGATVRRLMGLWQLRGRLGRAFSALLAGMTLVSIAFLVVGALLKLCVDPPTGLEQLALSMLVATVCTGFFIRAALFVAKGATLRQTVWVLADTRAQFCNGDNTEMTRTRYQTLSNKIYFYWQMVSTSATISWVAAPLLPHIFAKGDQQEVPWQLPAPIWLPADVFSSPTFECLYVVQSFCIAVVIQSGLSIDIFFIHMMLMAAAELQVLNCNISTMGHNNFQELGMEEKGYNKVLSSAQSFDGQILADDVAHKLLHQQLVKNVLHHQAIIRSVSLLQSAMNVSIFSLLLVNMANLCSSLFVAIKLLQEDFSVVKALNAFSTIPEQLYETALFCIYGQLLIDQSEKLMHSAFSCAWVNSDARFKRSLLIFMVVTMRPVVVTVGKTCTLSKQMLIQVLNGAYALLNMLYNIH